jgi:hypothetical protein
MTLLSSNTHLLKIAYWQLRNEFYCILTLQRVRCTKYPKTNSMEQFLRKWCLLIWSRGNWNLMKEPGTSLSIHNIHSWTSCWISWNQATPSDNRVATPSDNRVAQRLRRQHSQFVSRKLKFKYSVQGMKGGGGAIPRGFHDKPPFPKENCTSTTETRHERFLPHPSSFTTQRPTILYVADTVSRL